MVADEREEEERGDGDSPGGDSTIGVNVAREKLMVSHKENFLLRDLAPHPPFLNNCLRPSSSRCPFTGMYEDLTLPLTFLVRNKRRDEINFFRPPKKNDKTLYLSTRSHSTSCNGDIRSHSFYTVLRGINIPCGHRRKKSIACSTF